MGDEKEGYGMVGKEDMLTSLPECWDTLRAGTNEGYCDF
jgi:hypothetical protein